MKNKKIILTAVGLIFLFWSLSYYSRINIKTTSLPYLPPQAEKIKDAKNITELSFTAQEKTTVYDLMSELQDERKINFTEKNYIGMGKLIDSINGIKNTGEKNWIYYVNGQEAQVGISNYKVKPGDVVSWKYEKNVF